jgi:type I restriction enzyme R subunit
LPAATAPTAQAAASANSPLTATPSPAPSTAEPAPSRQQLQALAEQLAQAEALKRLAEERARQTEAELAQARADRDALIAQNQPQSDRHDYNEADTRRYLIDMLLQEAGWDPQQPGATEVEVEGMPNESGKGYVDYVLWGDDGKPLALVEAKRTTASPPQVNTRRFSTPTA